MKKQTYQTPTVEWLAFTAEAVLDISNTNPPELPDHDWVSYLRKADLFQEMQEK